MSRIFKNMVPYWKTILVIILLLLVQAWCDLSLPAYTSDIIDVGIQNNGIEHVLPEALTGQDYAMAQIFMTEEEKELWSSLYEQNGDIYERTETDEKQLEELDEQLLLPLLMVYQMTTASDAEGMAQTGDMTASPEAMQMAGLDEETILQVREKAQETIDTMGSSLVKSMGVAYAKSCDAAAGVDADAIQTHYLWTAGLKMVGLALLMGVVTVLVGFFAARVGAGIGMNLRDGVFKKVVGFSNAEMDRFSTASLITRSTNDIQQIQMVSIMLIRMIAYAPILGIGGIIKVVHTGAGMGWIIVLALLVILGYVGALMAVTMPKFKLMQQLVDRINLVSREILTGLSVIRAFGREKKEEERFDGANRDLTKTMLFTNRVMTFMMPGMMMIMNVLTVGIVWVGAHKIDAGTMQVGAMTAFITYAMMIVMSFLMLTAMSIMLPRAAVAADRIDEVLRTDSSIVDCENPQKLESHNGVVRFEHVNFRYPGAEEDVLSDIDFVAEPGKTTAIIGSTGCGKSTLVNLIPRLYDVTGGRITLDGVDIRNITMEDLREEIGMVPQKGVLFSGTIASNLRFGNRTASDEEVREAAQIAQAEEFIEEKEEKYESSIAQGGTNVSGGQKQRLAIARAIVKHPKIYVFDDSFSALDLKTDAALRRALAEKVKDATVLIVAQRISTILHAEQILVLNDGKIVGKGTHEELLATCETYQEIAKSQLSAKELGLKEEEVSDHE
uniref:ABC transporter ATP-binding protein n=1 Tax=Roseburia sp. TaxID=2049040 RepID=UPI003FEF18C0